MAQPRHPAVRSLRWHRAGVVLVAGLGFACGTKAPTAPDVTVVVGFFPHGMAPPGYHEAKAKIRHGDSNTSVTDAVVQVAGVRLDYDPVHDQYQAAVGDPLVVDVDVTADGFRLTGELLRRAQDATCTIEPDSLHQGFPSTVRWSWDTDWTPYSAGIGLADPSNIDGPLLWPSSPPGQPSQLVEDSSFARSDGLPDGGYQLQLPELPEPHPDHLLLVVESIDSVGQLKGGGRWGIANLCGRMVSATSAPLTSLSIEGRLAYPLTQGSAGSLTVIGHFGDGTTAEVTDLATWTSSDETILAVLAGGSVFTKALGTAQITATVHGVSGSVSVEVDPPNLVKVDVVAILARRWAALTLPIGFVGQLGAVGTFTDGSQEDLSPQATWQAGGTGIVSSGVVSVDAMGRFTTLVSGSGQVTASVGGLTGSIPVEVTDWTLRTLDAPAQLKDIVWTGSQVLAVGSGSAARSADGLAWSSSPLSAAVESVVWFPPQLVAVGEQSIVTSPDGVTWTARVAPTGSPPFALHSVAASTSRLVAAGDRAILESDDGATWTLERSDLTAEGVIWTGSTFLVVEPLQLVTSVDGMTWAAAANPGVTTAVASSGRLLVSIGSSSRLTSTDASTWSPTSSNNIAMRRMIWTGSEFIAVGDGGAIQRSADGSSWTGMTLSMGNLVAIASSGTRLVVLVEDGTVITQP